MQITHVKTQVVAGTNYILTLSLKDAKGTEHNVETVVWSRPWLEAKNDAENPAWKLTSLTVSE